MNEATTLRRHSESTHAVCGYSAIFKEIHRYIIIYQLQGKYRTWAKGAKFESKLPGDVAARKKKAEQTQLTLDASLVEKKLAKKVVPYSDQLFKTAAIQWLVATDQVCHLDI